MDDYALVLNAGSSSLKFCVFQRPKGKSWRLEARGSNRRDRNVRRVCPLRMKTVKVWPKKT